MSDTWYLFDSLRDLIGRFGEPGVPRRANKHLSALAAASAGALATPRRATLTEGSTRAKTALDDLYATGGVDDISPSFVAGRLAAMADILGLAASRRAPDDLAEQAVRYRGLLAALYDEALSNVALAARIGAREDILCKDLRIVRALGLVDTEKVGRDNVNQLTPIARALIEDGVLSLDSGLEYNMQARIQQIPAKFRPKAKPVQIPHLAVAGNLAVNPAVGAL